MTTRLGSLTPMHATNEPVPASVLSRVYVAPATILAAAGFGAADLIGGLSLSSPEPHSHRCGMGGLAFLFGLFMLAAGGPVLAVTAHMLTKGRGGVATAFLVGCLVLAAAAGLPLGVEGVLMTSMLPAVMITITAPVLMLTMRAVKRDDLEGDDTLLAGGALWLAALQLVMWVVFGPVLGIPPSGVGVGVGIAALALARIMKRRRWSAARACRGAPMDGPYRNSVAVVSQ